jgi:dolichol-phosphate mannosyltransferase
MLEENNATLNNSELSVLEVSRCESLALIIIPTFNEAENIARLLKELSALYPTSIDILVIDDNSPDGTMDIVRSMQSSMMGLHVIKRDKKLGLGTAYITGFHYALEQGYQYIIEMDADYSHDPAVVKSLLDAMKAADLVIGSRYMNNTVNVVNWPLGRLILSKLASVYTRIITGLPVDDPTSGYKCFSVGVLQALDLDSINSQGYSFQIEMNFRVWKKGFVIKEIPIVFVDRSVGKSKMTRKNIREAIWIVWWLKIKSIFGFL